MDSSSKMGAYTEEYKFYLVSFLNFVLVMPQVK